MREDTWSTVACRCVTNVEHSKIYIPTFLTGKHGSLKVNNAGFQFCDEEEKWGEGGGV